MSVAYAAGLVLAVALVGLTVDWQRLGRRFRRQPKIVWPTRVHVVPYLMAWGWPPEVIQLMSEGPFDVTTQTYRNGTTQIWLKRRTAA